MTQHRDQQLAAQLLERILEANLTPSQLATQLNITLADLSQWVLDSENLRVIEGLARLADIQAQMILSRYRVTAAAHLIAVAAAPEPSEISRKACVDLLTTDLNVFGAASDRGAENDVAPPPAPSEQAILETLERLARETEDCPTKFPPPAAPSVPLIN